MKVVQINVTCGTASTGKIVLAVSKILNEKDVENYIFYSQGQSDYKNSIKFTSYLEVKFQALFSRIFGNYGFDARPATKRLISHLKRINPDIIHIHNIHSHDCNLKMLFKYIKANNIKTYWTFHDCWAFTGYCPYFDTVGCDKWQTECSKCEQFRKYSWFLDCSKYNFKQKKKAVSGLDLTIITPSQWMADLVKKSFFSEYPVKVINNGIDLSVFKPMDSDFRKRYNCEDKFLILGVAFGWEARKGLERFLELEKRLDDRFKIVLVGTNDDIDGKLSSNIISIHRTQNQTELAKIYSAADLFVNPTMEENYPTVNMESLACGTPIVTFDAGGSAEMIDEICGSIVPKGDTEALLNEILRIQKENPFSAESCLNKAKAFDFNQKFNEYAELYKKYSMKVVQINVTCGIGSTGKIALAISEILDKNNTENYILYSQGHSDLKNSIKYTTRIAVKMQALVSRVCGNYGFEAKNATKKLISHLERIKPDIIHIHNIHSHDCNLEMLFNYIKANNIKIYWTFHDCWAFTGYCPHFDMVGCEKWKNECECCPQMGSYSWFFDRSKQNFNKKKKLFQNLDLTVITPSQWLADRVKESFLKDYPVKVINNGIDLSVFKPVDSNFREKHNCEDKFLILGVAFDWDRRKGLDVFIELSKRLDERFKIVLVGTNENVDKQLPANIISIHRTQNQTELAGIYTACDLFVNATREENYPTVNMESLACGTPVLTFNTGGSPEMLDETCGFVVEKDDIDALLSEIQNISENKPYSKENCLEKAKHFDTNARFKEYIELYNI